MSARKRREQEKQARATAILRGARKLFLKKGYEGTSVEAIARSLDIAKGTIYLYFNTKEDLFSAVLSEQGRAIFEGLKKSARKSRSAAVSLRAHARDYARARIKNTEFFRMLFHSFHRAGSRSSSREHIADLGRRHLEIIRDIIERGKESCEFNVKDVDDATEHVLALFRGTVMGHFWKDAKGDLERKLKSAASTIIDGLRRRAK